MKKILILLIVLVLCSSVASAGFWEDITGAFSLRDFFPTKEASVTPVVSEEPLEETLPPVDELPDDSTSITDLEGEPISEDVISPVSVRSGVFNSVGDVSMMLISSDSSSGWAEIKIKVTDGQILNLDGIDYTVGIADNNVVEFVPWCAHCEPVADIHGSETGIQNLETGADSLETGADSIDTGITDIHGSEAGIQNLETGADSSETGAASSGIDQLPTESGGISSSEEPLPTKPSGSNFIMRFLGF